jgi:hypothetical protein
MLGVTLFGIFLTPVFYFVIQWASDKRAEYLERAGIPESENDEPPGRGHDLHAEPSGNGHPQPKHGEHAHAHASNGKVHQDEGEGMSEDLVTTEV